MTAAMLNTAIVGRVAGGAGAREGGGPGAGPTGWAVATGSENNMPATPSAADKIINGRFTPKPSSGPLCETAGLRQTAVTTGPRGFRSSAAHTGPRRGLSRRTGSVANASDHMRPVSP